MPIGRPGDSPKSPNSNLSWLESLGSGITQTQLCPMLEEQAELDSGGLWGQTLHVYAHVCSHYVHVCV